MFIGGLGNYGLVINGTRGEQGRGTYRKGVLRKYYSTKGSVWGRKGLAKTRVTQLIENGRLGACSIGTLGGQAINSIVSYGRTRVAHSTKTMNLFVLTSGGALICRLASSRDRYFRLTKVCELLFIVNI